MNPALTVTVRSTDRPSHVLQRIEHASQHVLGLDDLSLPFDGRDGSVKDLIQSAQSYLREAYDFELRLVGYCPPELARGDEEEWTLAFRTHKAHGATTSIVDYDPLA